MLATGIQIDGPILRYATVKQNYRDLRILDLQTLPIHDQKVKPLYFGQKGTQISGLMSSDLIIRAIPFVATMSRKLKKALVLQTEAQLHFKADDLITTAVINAKAKRATTYSTTRSALATHLQELGALQLDPERVGAIPAALKAFVRWKAPEVSSYFLIDLGWGSVNCIWVENDELQKAHAIRFGLQQLKNAFLEDRKKLNSKEKVEIDFTEFKTSQYPTLAEEAKAFRRELSKILHSFQCQRPLILTGELTSNGLKEFLLEALHDCISEEKNIGLSVDEQRYASCIGLSLDYLINRQQPIQFRSGSPVSCQKLGRISTSLFVAAGAFCALVFGVSSMWMDQREAEIIHSLETWTAAKDPALRLELFSAGSQTKDLVDQWLKLIEKNAADYRFIMKAPRVSQFLDWLSHHPLVESFRMAGDPISFEHIRYQLVSFPRLEALNEPYLTKVDIDFKVESPLHARKFHETLLQGDSLIDTSHEITWDVLSDRYKVSFYLKNECYGNF